MRGPERNRWGTETGRGKEKTARQSDAGGKEGGREKRISVPRIWIKKEAQTLPRAL